MVLKIKKLLEKYDWKTSLYDTEELIHIHIGPITYFCCIFFPQISSKLSRYCALLSTQFPIVCILLCLIRCLVTLSMDYWSISPWPKVCANKTFCLPSLSSFLDPHIIKIPWDFQLLLSWYSKWLGNWNRPFSCKSWNIQPLAHDITCFTQLQRCCKE